VTRMARHGTARGQHREPGELGSHGFTQGVHTYMYEDHYIHTFMYIHIYIYM
jgi:hypothetical protein